MLRLWPFGALWCVGSAIAVVGSDVAAEKREEGEKEALFVFEEGEGTVGDGIGLTRFPFFFLFFFFCNI